MGAARRVAGGEGGGVARSGGGWRLVEADEDEVVLMERERVAEADGDEAEKDRGARAVNAGGGGPLRSSAGSAGPDELARGWNDADDEPARGDSCESLDDDGVMGQLARLVELRRRCEKRPMLAIVGCSRLERERRGAGGMRRREEGRVGRRRRGGALPGRAGGEAASGRARAGSALRRAARMLEASDAPGSARVVRGGADSGRDARARSRRARCGCSLVCS